MGGKSTISTSATKYDTMQLSSATEGVARPLVWGKTRISTNLIDYIDFQAHAHKSTQSSGKGGSTKHETTDYSYTVAIIMMLCEGEIGGVSRVWKGTDAPQSLSDFGLTYTTGKALQAPWSYMESRHPERALSYSGLATVQGVYDLGSNANMPNLRFEVYGRCQFSDEIVDAHPKDILIDFLTNEDHGVGFPVEHLGDWTQYEKYCTANGLFLSPALMEQSEAREFIDNVLAATNSNSIWSEGLLKIIPYGDEAVAGNGAAFEPDITPIYDLDDDDFLYEEGEDPVKIQRGSASDAHNQIQIEYLNRDNNYATDIATAKDQADIEEKGLRPADVVKMHFICDKVTANKMAHLLLRRKVYVRNTYTFMLPWNYVRLEPMDLVTLTDKVLGLDKTVVRITQIEENEEGALSVVAEDCPLGVSGSVLYPSQDRLGTNRDYNVDPGSVDEPVLFTMPDALAENGLELGIAVSGGQNWGGCEIWVSEDGDSYKYYGTVRRKARKGALTKPLAAGAAWDIENVLSVALRNTDGQLLSGTQQDAENLNTLCYVDGEFIAYQTSTLTGEKSYDLTNLVRGACNSTISQHPDGSAFVRVDDNVFTYPFTREQVGKQLYFKFLSFNIYGAALENLDEVEPILHTLTWNPPPDVSDIVLSENTYILKDGTVLTDVKVDFTEPAYSYLGYYNVFYRLNSSDLWTFAGSTAKSGYVIKALPNTKEVMVKVVTVNKALNGNDGVISEPLQITGKSDPPADVGGFSVSIDPYNRANVLMEWEENADLDLRGYEVSVIYGAGAFNRIGLFTTTNCSFTVPDSGDYTFAIRALDNSGNYSRNAQTQTISVNVNPSAPAFGTASLLATDRSYVVLTWEANKDADFSLYEVTLDGVRIGTPREATLNYRLPDSGSYTFIVRAKNVAGFYSDELRLTIDAVITPQNVTNFTVSQNSLDRRIIEFSWTGVSDSDLAYYEIRQGGSWEASDATVIATNIKGTSFSTPPLPVDTPEQNINYLIRAVNASGRTSLMSASAFLQLDMVPDAPETGTITQDPYNSTTLIISWSGVSDTDIIGYEVKHGDEVIGMTKETSLKYSVSESGTYIFTVAAKTFGGKYSATRTISKEVKIEPEDVQGFTVSQMVNDHSVLRLTWKANTEKDLAYYEIREGGSSWESSTPIGKNLTGVLFDYNISQEREYQFFIKAFNISGNESVIAASTIPSTFLIRPSAPSNLNVTVDPLDKSSIILTWDGILDKDLQTYEVRIGDWDDNNVVAITKELKTTYRLPKSGTYAFSVRAKNTSGYYSNAATYPDYVAYIEPADVTGFQVAQNGTEIEMIWDAVQEVDVVGYEIRRGSTFDTGTLVVSGLSETLYSVKAETETTYRYHIKAINRAGLYSQREASSSVHVTNLPPKNVIQSYDEVTAQNGTHSNTEFGVSMINWSNLGGTWADYPTTRFEEVGGATVLKLKGDNLVTTKGLIDGSAYRYNMDAGTFSGNSAPASNHIDITAFSERYIIVGQSVEIETYGKGAFYCQCYFLDSANTNLGHRDWVYFGAVTEKTRHVVCLDKTTFPTGTVKIYFSWCWWNPTSDCTGKAIVYGDLVVRKSAVHTTAVMDSMTHYPESGTYLTTQKDMGQIIQANIGCDFISSILLRSGVSAGLQYKTSRDGNTWSNWLNFSPVLATFRYIQFQVILNTKDSTITPEVNRFIVSIDVPDTDKAGTATVAVGGSTVNYGHNYFTNPAVIPTALGAGLRAELISIGKSNFTVKVIRISDGADVGGTITWLSRGY